MEKKNKKQADVLRRQETPTVAVRIDRLVDREDSKIKAYASVNIGGAFVVQGLRIVESQNGLFVQMPQRSYLQDGKTVFKDVCFPITAEARRLLADTALQAYDMSLAAAQETMEDDPKEDMEAPEM